MILLLLVLTAVTANATSFPGAVTKLVCEHSTLTLSCQSGYLLKIHSANYGRDNWSTCPHPKIQTNKCAASTSLLIVKQSCEGKQSCSVRASNYIFGDPCQHTYKYLQASYSCVRSQDTLRKLACEGSTLRLTCNYGYSLRIDSANYGRDNWTTCPHHSIKTNHCSASASLSIVKQSCDGKRTCAVRASNSIFGDPCVYTYKYLKASYKCVKN